MLTSTPRSIIMSLSCSKCERLYNLTTRLPILHSCCADSTCLQCWRGSFASPEEDGPGQGGFRCLFECGAKDNEVYKAPRVNVAVRRILEKEMLTTDVQCEVHPEQIVHKYHPASQKLQCSKCTPVGSQMVIEADRRVLERSCHKLLKMLDAQNESIRRDFEAKKSEIDESIE